MTPQIKQRIEQLRRGEVPEGYKKSKIGIVPNEWEETSFFDLFTSTNDFTDDLTQYPLYSLTIEDGITAKTDRYERSHLVKKENAYKIVRPNDFAYNPMNVRFGAVARHKGTIDVSVSGYYDIFTTKSESDLEFMDSFLISDKMIAYYNKICIGSLVEKQRVHFSQFMDFHLPIPSASERKKIAEILSAQDKLIVLKEKLIEEKKRQKKYLMQQLLTGKIRLPGFSGEWKTYSFSEIFTFLTTNTLSRDCMTDERSDINNIHYGDILTKYTEVLDCEKVQLPYIKNDVIPQTTEFIQDGDIIIADTAEDITVGKAIEIKNAREVKIISGLHTMFCRPIEGTFSPGWLGYYMNSDAYHKQLIPLICGVKVSSISKKEIVNTLILTPPPKEQTAVVNILSTIDRELDLLNRELDQEKQKKKALMQLLLSGVVRVNA